MVLNVHFQVHALKYTHDEPSLHERNWQTEKVKCLQYKCDLMEVVGRCKNKNKNKKIIKIIFSVQKFLICQNNANGGSGEVEERDGPVCIIRSSFFNFIFQIKCK